MFLHDRIKVKLDEKGLKQADLARATEKSSVAVTKWMRGENTPKTDALKAIAKLLGVSDEWLLSGKEVKKEKNTDSVQADTNISSIKPRMAPVLSWVQAGNWTDSSAVELSEVSKWIPLPEDVCEKCYYLEVRGISNYPVFQEGDFVLVDPTVCYSDIHSGDMIVVRKDTDATFKKLVIEPDNSRYLQALNPEFKPNIIQIDESCMFIGQVIDCVRYVYTAPSRRKAH